MEEQRLNSNEFSEFLRKSFRELNPGTSYKHNWHIDLICDKLMDVYEGRVRRLIINLPPRSLKSICATVAFPAFVLGKDPSKRIIAASYSASLSEKLSLDSRSLMESDWYREAYPDTCLKRGQNRKNKFMTDMNGFRMATSFFGNPIGEGGDILIVDDPHNPARMFSANERNRALEWFNNIFMTRLDDKSKGAIIIVMQRLHKDDLTGHILKNELNGWDHLVIPAIAEEDINYVTSRSEYQFKKDSLLHEERENLDQLDELKRQIGNDVFAAQYMQDPNISMTQIIRPEWVKYYHPAEKPDLSDAPPDSDNIIHIQKDKKPNKTNHKFDFKATNSYILQSWDTACGDDVHNHYSSCTTWLVAEYLDKFTRSTRSQMFLLDAFKEKLCYPTLKKAVISQSEKWGPRTILIEEKSSGKQLLQDLKQAHIPVRGSSCYSSKSMRLAEASVMIESGEVHFPSKSEFIESFMDELLGFPFAQFDDQVDSTSQAIRFVHQNKHQSSFAIRRL